MAGNEAGGEAAREVEGVGRILVVDDDPFMRELMRGMLREHPAQIRVARDVTEARAVIGTFRPQVIFLDVALSGPRDGLELCAELRSGADAWRSLVIVISAHGALADIDAALRAGAHGYLLKPFSATQVRGVLDAAEAWLLGAERPFRHYWPFDRHPPLAVIMPGAAGAALPAVTQAAARKGPILVAEDDPVNRKIILKQLSVLGYQADAVEDGERALELWRAGGYAMLLTDLHMPRMDGYVLVQTIRAEEQKGGRPRAPILALSGTAPEGAEPYRDAGIDAYLGKPLQLDVLRDSLQRWLANK
ncbi:response regulator [Aromatoleum petrolei]|uniref:response regulator n=1 Tax=Aromatoleum petrolei TaxID=76116 RepID=UPI00145F7744|nr:response regulator [Aromatoleum petrolei]